MNIRLAIIFLTTIAIQGCDVPDKSAVDNGYGLKRLHDDEKSVTCWKLGSGTLSCYPDWMLNPHGANTMGYNQ